MLFFKRCFTTVVLQTLFYKRCATNVVLQNFFYNRCFTNVVLQTLFRRLESNVDPIRVSTIFQRLTNVAVVWGNVVLTLNQRHI